MTDLDASGDVVVATYIDGSSFEAAALDAIKAWIHHSLVGFVVSKFDCNACASSPKSDTSR